MGRGSRQRGLQRSRFANPFKVAHYGRELAISVYSHDMENGRSAQVVIVDFSRLRITCHCAERQSCHADILIAACEKDFPGAVRLGRTSPPAELLGRLREEVESDEGSSADEGAAPNDGADSTA